jgi:hypothetical protein
VGGQVESISTMLHEHQSKEENMINFKRLIERKGINSIFTALSKEALHHAEKYPQGFDLRTFWNETSLQLEELSKKHTQ